MSANDGYKTLEDDEGSETLSIDNTRRPTDQFEVDEVLELPRWRREQQRIPKLPHAVQRIASLIRGPDPPQVHAIESWFPGLQEKPLRLVDRLVDGRQGRKIAIFVLFLICYAAIWVPLMLKYWDSGTINHKYLLRRLSCTDSFWHPRNECGLDGIDCRPLTDDRLAFRCPAGCTSTPSGPVTVGTEEVTNRPLVIGGPIYRGDSSICASAIHTGIVRNSGGCGIVSRVGTHDDFTSSTRNGVTSIEFNSSFPLSIAFEAAGHCEISEHHWGLLGLSAGFTVILSLCTSSASLLFFTILPIIFFQIGMVSDPTPEVTLPNQLFSILMGKFPLTVFCMFVVYQFCVKLHGLRAQMEKTLLWLCPYWIGALLSERWLPTQSLTPGDGQPGMKAAIILGIVLFFFMVCQQIYYIHREGSLPRYLVFYGVLITLLVSLSLLPNLELRMPHYLLVLALLPGTSIQTRSSLIYQGLLLGLFVGAIVRFDLDSIVQTEVMSRYRENGKLGSLVPDIGAPLVATATNITLALAIPFTKSVRVGTAFRGIMGISVLINDVERFRQHADVEPNPNFTWYRANQEPQYFRFAYVAEEITLDYTQASIWHADGTWEASKGIQMTEDVPNSS